MVRKKEIREVKGHGLKKRYKEQYTKERDEEGIQGHNKFFKNKIVPIIQRFGINKYRKIKCLSKISKYLNSN